MESDATDSKFQTKEPDPTCPPTSPLCSGVIGPITAELEQKTPPKPNSSATVVKQIKWGSQRIPTSSFSQSLTTTPLCP